ncbi:MAG: chemotaxis protein CheX [Syntrophobacteraceae bacterium]
MSVEWRSAMRAAISEVLETMFFSLAEFDDCSEPASAYDYGASISLFKEERRMEIQFKLKAAFARMITANLLGIDEEAVTTEDLEDTLKELANMVGGNYQARLADTSWRLGIPSLVQADEPCGGGASELVFSCFGEPAGALEFRSDASGENAPL